MKYTKSKDGILRCNMNIKYRFTKEEMEKYTKLGKKHWTGSFRYALHSYGIKALEMLDEDFDEAQP